MSIYMLMFIGTGPIGSLLAGVMAKYIGAPVTIVAFAAVSLISAIVICFRPGGLKDMVPAHVLTQRVPLAAEKPLAKSEA